MPGEFSDTGGKRALDAVTGRATVTLRTTYLALLTAAPSDATTDGTITFSEYQTPGSNGYNRATVTWSAPSGTNSSTTSNTAQLTFGPFTGGVGAAVTYAALVSVSTGTAGDLLAFWQLDASRTPAVNDSITIAASALTLTVD